MSLTEYKHKRDFRKTSEPKGKVKRPGKQLSFVVQKHQASHLHYDFRLELDGVLKSWAVPKGPSLNPKHRRLAMQVEDHPYDYRNFEGTIPKGNYGAGEVIVWDRGTYEPAVKTDKPEKELLQELKKGHLRFELHGEKLKGKFALVRNDKLEENAWLLLKKDDEAAQSRDVTKQAESVLSHRTVESIKESLEQIDAPQRKILTHVKPMLATLVREPFDDDGWLYEIKWDGYRAIGAWDGRQAELYSRSGKDFSLKYSPVYEALQQLDRKVVLDGEIVVVDKEGKSHFNWLQNYQKSPRRGSLAYYVFDILWCDGHDVQSWPLNKRKQLLQKVLGKHKILRYSDHVVGRGTQFFKMATREGLEGIMAKRADSPYNEGQRSDLWLKVKAHLRQEVVIGGFTEPKGQRKHIGALLVGVYDKGRLKYVGHVGGGIPPAQLQPLRARLEKLERKTCPFSQKVRPNSRAHWVTPKLLCEVTFGEWTPDGRLRQPIFVGLRGDDKPAREVHQELPKDSAKPTTKGAAMSRVQFTNRDKVFWPKQGYTKGELIDYYQAVSEYMLPYLLGRPHTLLRHPNGQTGKSFFQKDVAGTLPDWAKTVSVYSESNDKDLHYLVCDSLDALLLMAQLGCIEINPWSSTTKHMHKPDWTVLDLDPEGVEFKDVIKVALQVKAVCDELKIPSYPKTSGKTGIHIFIPLGARYSYEQSKNFAELLASLVHERTKDITSLERNPGKRQHKIYIDYLQNRETQTLAAPYSVRPTAAASVSTPLSWDEVNQKLDPSNFTLKNTLARIQKVGDLWRPVLDKGIDLKTVLDKME